MQRATLHFGLKKFLRLKKSRLSFMLLINYVINDLNGEENTGTFYEKELQNIDQQEFQIEKVIKKKGDKLHVKDMAIHLIVRLTKKT